MKSHENYPFPVRKIIHVDMDAFYASVEQLDYPELKGKPIAVGGGTKRGVVAAASYEARKYGVRSAMPGFKAKERCANLVFVKPRFQRYKEISKQIRNIFLEFTHLVEPLSLDEAYLDVTENKKGNPSATLIAKEIRDQIWQELNLTASAGISINKFVAKVASDYHKPNGQKTIPPEEVLSFLEQLNIRKFYGIGKITASKMYGLGIFSGKELKQKPLTFLQENFGKSGLYYYSVVRGIHSSKVKTHRVAKSIGAERTFQENINNHKFMLEKLTLISEEIQSRLHRYELAGKTVTLKLKYSDFTTQTRSKTVANYVSDKKEVLEIITQLLMQGELKHSVRLLGISISNLNRSDNQKLGKQENVSAQLTFDF